MNLAQLKAFIAVVEKQSFSDAARALGVSQPAVTLQIQALEQQVGAALLERRYKKVGMTEAGRLVLPVATSIVASWERLADDIWALEGSVGGRLVVGGSTTPAHYLLPTLVGRFKADHPDTAVLLEVADTRDTVERLKSGEVDIAFVGEAVKERRIACEPFADDEIVLVAPPSHPFAGRRKPVSLADVVTQPLVFREKGSATRDVVEAHLSKHGIAAGDLDIVLELGTSEAVANAAEAGLGLAILPVVAVEKSLALGRLVVVPVESLPIKRHFYLCVLERRTLSRAAGAFLAFARSQNTAT